MQKAKIVFLCVVLAILYGVVHDQITVRLSLEYFTLAHPAIFKTTSPTLLALCWGVAAPLGVGLLFGMLLAQASQSPGMPPMSISAVMRPVCIVFVNAAAAAAIAGLIGTSLVRSSIIGMGEPLSEILSPQQQERFVAVQFAHVASYLFGTAGTAVVLARIWTQRRRPKLFTLYPHSRAEFFRMALLIAIAAVIIWWRWSTSAR